jgi:hypothetical protein
MKRIPRNLYEFYNWLPEVFHIGVNQLAEMADNGISPCMCTTCGEIFNLDVDATSGHCTRCGQTRSVLNPMYVFEGLTRGKIIKQESTSRALPSLDLGNPLIDNYN